MNESLIFLNNRSDFLFARPTFSGGMARIFDFAGTLNIYNVSQTESEADIRALTQDWKAVGDSIRTAYEEFQIVYGKKTSSEIQAEK